MAVVKGQRSWLGFHKREDKRPKSNFVSFVKSDPGGLGQEG